MLKMKTQSWKCQQWKVFFSMFLWLQLLCRVGSSSSSSSSSVETNNEGTKTIEADQQQIHQLGMDMIHALQAQGGFIHENLEIRRRNPQDPLSPSGVFVKDANIPKGTQIFHFPPTSYFSLSKDKVIPYNEDDDDDDEDDEDDESEQEEEIDEEAMETIELEVMSVYFDNICLLAEHFLNETKMAMTDRSLLDNLSSSSSKSNSSNFGPYFRYLTETQPRGQTPAAYSAAGKAILRRIQGLGWNDTATESFISENYGRFPLPPNKLVDWIDDYYVSSDHERCLHAKPRHDLDDNNAYNDMYHAIALTVQRGFDLELIPIWDMVNHDNQDLNVETNSLRNSTEGLIVTTIKELQVGDEVLYTYDYCVDCEHIGDVWGTPGIYRDFGFVEDYPQYWPFLDQKVFVSIEKFTMEENKTVNDHDSSDSDEQGDEDEDEDEDDDDGDDEDGEKPGFYDMSSMYQYQDDLYYAYIYAKEEEEDKFWAPNAEGLKFFQIQLDRLEALDLKDDLDDLVSSLERFMIAQYYASLKIALGSTIEASKKLNLLKKEKEKSLSSSEDMENDPLNESYEEL